MYSLFKRAAHLFGLRATPPAPTPDPQLMPYGVTVALKAQKILQTLPPIRYPIAPKDMENAKISFRQNFINKLMVAFAATFAHTYERQPKAFDRLRELQQEIRQNIKAGNASKNQILEQRFVRKVVDMLEETLKQSNMEAIDPIATIQQMAVDIMPFGSRRASKQLQKADFMMSFHFGLEEGRLARLVEGKNNLQIADAIHTDIVQGIEELAYTFGPAPDKMQSLLQATIKHWNHLPAEVADKAVQVIWDRFGHYPEYYSDPQASHVVALSTQLAGLCDGSITCAQADPDRSKSIHNHLQRLTIENVHEPVKSLYEYARNYRDDRNFNPLTFNLGPTLNNLRYEIIKINKLSPDAAKINFQHLYNLLADAAAEKIMSKSYILGEENAKSRTLMIEPTPGPNEKAKAPAAAAPELPTAPPKSIFQRIFFRPEAA